MSITARTMSASNPTFDNCIMQEVFYASSIVVCVSVFQSFNPEMRAVVSRNDPHLKDKMSFMSFMSFILPKNCPQARNQRRIIFALETTL